MIAGLYQVKVRECCYQWRTGISRSERGEVQGSRWIHLPDQPTLKLTAPPPKSPGHGCTPFGTRRSVSQIRTHLRLNEKTHPCDGSSHDYEPIGLNLTELAFDCVIVVVAIRVVVVIWGLIAAFNGGFLATSRLSRLVHGLTDSLQSSLKFLSR